MLSNILYISYDGMTDPLGQSQVLPYLIGLSKQGYSFTLLSFEKKEKFDVGRQVIEKICKEHNINWVPQFYTKKPPVVSTIKDVRKMRQKAKALHAQYNFAIVHCRSYISALVGLWMKNKYGVKFVFDMRGFWADERVDGNLWNLQNPVYKRVYQFFKNKEKQFLEQADYTISLTQNAQDEIQSWKHIHNRPIPIQVIPCCVDIDLFNPEKVSENAVEQKKKELGIQATSKVVSYIGSMGTWYMLDEMLDFFKVNMQQDGSLVFLFVTPDDKSVIHNRAKEKNIPLEKIIVVSAKRSEMPLYISLCNFSLFFIRPTYSKKASSPTKQGEIMAMGVPVICNSGVGDTDYIINKFNSGMLVHEFTPKEYEYAYKGVATSPMPTIRQGAVDFFSLERGIHLYNQVYQKILSLQKINKSL